MAVTIVDGDSIYFRAAFVTKKKNEIRKVIDETMKEINVAGMMNDMQVAVKGRGNFRHDLYPKYKATRPELDQEMKDALNYGHDHMVKKWLAAMADGMEADDLVSIWAREARDMSFPYLIAGIDKDLRQIPGNHYNYKTKAFETISEDDAKRNLYLQTLIGDSSDNIPGLKGIGPKKAAKILQGIRPDRYERRCRAAWRKHGNFGFDISLRLLKMIETWEEYEEITNSLLHQASKRKQDVLPEQEEDERVFVLSGTD